MALIPIAMLDQLRRQNLMPLTNPNKDQVVQKLDEMTTILNDEHLPDSVEAARLNEKVKNYSTFADKLVDPMVHQQHKYTPSLSSPPLQQDMFASLPTTYRAPANVLMRELEKHSDTIQWNPITHEVKIKGQTLKGSNVVDLISDVMRTRKTAKIPLHGRAFLKLLADLNLPESFVKNKYRISQFRSYKQGDGEDDDNDDDDDTSFRQREVARARKRLEASGTRRFNGTKRFQSSSYRWKPI